MQSDLDVAIVHHPTGDVNRPILLPAMGLLSLADRLVQAGIRAEVFNLAVERVVDPNFDLVAHLLDRSVKVVGLSAHWFFQLPDVLALARTLAEALPRALVVLGGFSASLFAHDIVRDHPGVGAVVRGDGEEPFLRLCRAHLAGSTDWHDVANLVYRAADGGVREAPFHYVADEAELARCRFSNLGLLRYHGAFLDLACYPTRRFKDRFHLDAGGVFPLEVGRGCPFSCVFCGGNREAQRRMCNRTRPAFRTPEAVVDSMREVMTYGCRNFYVCFDPEPNGPYYHELFGRVRDARLDARLIFGAWGLPDAAFVDDVRDTFRDAMFEISPETSDEGLRRAAKGPLAFSNAALEACIGHIESRGLLCQLFFGYFLPGDTADSVLATARFARAHDRGGCETFYLAFSTDPASRLQLWPDAHGVHVDVRTLQDYLDLLARPRVSPNLLAHRPLGMSEEQSTDIQFRLALDPLVRKVFPHTLDLLRSGGGREEAVERLVEQVCAALSADMRQAGIAVRMDVVVAEMKRQAAAAGLLGPDGPPQALFEDAVALEAMPYQLRERHFAPVSIHYSVYFYARDLDGDALAAFVARPDTVTERRTFRYDLARLFAQGPPGHGLPFPDPSPTDLTVAVNRNGQVVTYVAPRPAAARGPLVSRP